MYCEMTYSWCPQDPKGVEHHILDQWLLDKLGPGWRNWWLHEIDSIARQMGHRWENLVGRICERDTPELIELLYPIAPAWFQTPFVLDGRGGELNALCRCALRGSVGCVDALLELGADPNGLDALGKWNYLHLEDALFSPITPLDCAVRGGHEECCFLLELFGAQTVQELCTLPPEVMPESIRS